jgi:hypothetical protein
LFYLFFIFDFGPWGLGLATFSTLTMGLVPLTFNLGTWGLGVGGGGVGGCDGGGGRVGGGGGGGG